MFIDPTGLRAVRGREIEALIWTFGEAMGNYLAGVIDIEIKDLDGLAGQVPWWTTSKIYLQTGYSENNLKNLSTFIHEATHIWQIRTGRHSGWRGGGDYDYTVEQLRTLDLKKEEHAEAVQNWFYATYGTAEMNLTGEDAWAHLTKHNLSFKGRFTSKNRKPPVEWVLGQVDTNYAAVIDEIRYVGYIRDRTLFFIPIFGRF